jgi:hypothetical protein
MGNVDKNGFGNLPKETRDYIADINARMKENSGNIQSINNHTHRKQFNEEIQSKKEVKWLADTFAYRSDSKQSDIDAIKSTVGLNVFDERKKRNESDIKAMKYHISNDFFKPFKEEFSYILSDRNKRKETYYPSKLSSNVPVKVEITSQAGSGINATVNQMGAGAQ